MWLLIQWTRESMFEIIDFKKPFQFVGIKMWSFISHDDHFRYAWQILIWCVWWHIWPLNYPVLQFPDNGNNSPKQYTVMVWIHKKIGANFGPWLLSFSSYRHRLLNLTVSVFCTGVAQSDKLLYCNIHAGLVFSFALAFAYFYSYMSFIHPAQHSLLHDFGNNQFSTFK